MRACAALLACVAISKGRRRRQRVAEVRAPPNAMGWGLNVFGEGAVERLRNKPCFFPFLVVLT